MMPGGLHDELDVSSDSETARYLVGEVAQVQAVVRRVAEVTARHPHAAAYSPGAIL